MPAISPPNNPAASAPPPPRYRGLSGALFAGLSAMGMIVLIGILLGAALGLLTKSAAPAVQLIVRFALLGATAGGAVALSRLICGTATHRLLSFGWVRGEGSGSIGWLVGLVLAGYLADRQLPPRDRGEVQPAVGQAIDISGPTLDGGRFDLAEHRGKVVLVDFWATWCGPCVAELPNVRATYDKYHDDGFEVVAVSLDFERAHLAKFLEAHPEPWPQLFFDADGQRGWDNPLARRYGVRAIPFLLIVDRDGKVVSRDVRGQQIEAAVAEALGRPVAWSDRLVTVGWRLVGWLFNGVLGSPWWLLLLCGIGGAAVLASAEAAMHRTFRFSRA